MFSAYFNYMKIIANNTQQLFLQIWTLLCWTYTCLKTRSSGLWCCAVLW